MYFVALTSISTSLLTRTRKERFVIAPVKRSLWRTSEYLRSDYFYSILHLLGEGMSAAWNDLRALWTTGYFPLDANKENDQRSIGWESVHRLVFVPRGRNVRACFGFWSDVELQRFLCDVAEGRSLPFFSKKKKTSTSASWKFYFKTLLFL